MNRNTMISTALVGLAIVGLVTWSRMSDGAMHASVEARSTSAFNAPETKHDFGLITMKSGNVEHVFTLSNSTGKDLVLERLSSSCMCTTAYVVEAESQIGPFGMGGMGAGITVNKVVKAGESTQIKVVFDPNAHGPGGVGPMERYVHVADSNGGVLPLKLTGLVRP